MLSHPGPENICAADYAVYTGNLLTIKVAAAKGAGLISVAKGASLDTLDQMVSVSLGIIMLILPSPDLGSHF